jgi:Methyltransferase domain
MLWRRVLYNLMYRFSTPRWDTNITPPEVVAVIEGDAAFPPSRALDLGCGPGTNVIYLAQHGWEAIGVDFSPLAIQQARKKAGAFLEPPLSKETSASCHAWASMALSTLCSISGASMACRFSLARPMPRRSRALPSQGQSSCSGRSEALAGPCFPAFPLCRTRKSPSTLARISSWSACRAAKGAGGRTGIRYVGSRIVLTPSSL